MRCKTKPTEVEAVQFWAEQKPWPEGVYEDYIFTDEDGCCYKGFIIDTPDGRVPGSSGEWVITTANGERFWCDPDAFEDMYDPIKTTDAGTKPAGTHGGG